MHGDCLICTATCSSGARTDTPGNTIGRRLPRIQLISSKIRMFATAFSAEGHRIGRRASAARHIVAATTLGTDEVSILSAYACAWSLRRNRRLPPNRSMCGGLPCWMMVRWSRPSPPLTKRFGWDRPRRSTMFLVARHFPIRVNETMRYPTLGMHCALTQVVRRPWSTEVRSTSIRENWRRPGPISARPFAAMHRAVAQFFEQGIALENGHCPHLALAEYRKAICLDPMPYTEAYLHVAKNRGLDDVVAGFRQVLRLRADVDPVWLRWLTSWLPETTRGTDKLPGTVFASDMPSARATCGWYNFSVRRDCDIAGGTLATAGLPRVKGIFNHAFPGTTPADVVIDISGRKFAVFKAQAGLEDHGAVRFQVLVDGTLKSSPRVLRFGEVEPICVDVAGGKEVVLRVLNDGSQVNYCDRVAWGDARFIEAGAEDPLEEPFGTIRSATEANVALFLAEVHWRLSSGGLARRWFDKANAWIAKNNTRDGELARFRIETAGALGIK